MEVDVRWKQRLANYRRALQRLDEAVLLMRQRGLSELERQGLIQAFEFTHELAWNVMKDWFEYQGNSVAEEIATAVDSRYWQAFHGFLDVMEIRASAA
jgi:hypothetical protein